MFRTSYLGSLRAFCTSRLPPPHRGFASTPEPPKPKSVDPNLCSCPLTGASSSSSGHFSLAKEQSATDKLGTGPKTRYAVPGADPDSATTAGKKKRQRNRKKGSGLACEERGDERDIAECNAAILVDAPPAAGMSQQCAAWTFLALRSESRGNANRRL